MSGFVALDNAELDLHLSNLGGTGFSLYVVLKRFAGSNGECYPSFTKLEEVTGFSRHRITRGLTDLERKGYVSPIKGARGTRNSYVVHPLSEVSIQPDQLDSEESQTSAETAPVPKRNQCRFDTKSSAVLIQKVVTKRHSKNNHEEEPIRRDSPPSAALLFEAFWQAYPARNGKKALKKSALEWWTRHRVNDETARLIMSGLENQKPLWAQEGNKFVPDAIRFLRNERWKDEIVQGPEIDMSKFQTKRLSDEIPTCSPEELAEARTAAREAFRGTVRPSAAAEFRNGTSRPGFDVDREAGNREGGGYTPTLRLLPASTS